MPNREPTIDPSCELRVASGVALPAVPAKLWSLAVESLWDGEDYVLFLSPQLRIVGANESFERQILQVIDRPVLDLKDTLSPPSGSVLEQFVDVKDSAFLRLELIHAVRSGMRTVQYEFRRYEDGWLAIGKDRSIQIELVSQLAMLVNDLEECVDLEKERSERLKLLSEKDPLTGLANRRELDRVVESHTRDYSENGELFAVISIDVDHFKQVNDRFGHRMGDEVLKRIARTLHLSLRGNDCVARTGGEEFMVIARGLGADGAEQLAERLRRAVEKTEMPPPLGMVTVSVGVACAPAQVGGDAIGDLDLIQKADDALYRAKRNGRNCVCVAEMPAQA